MIPTQYFLCTIWPYMCPPIAPSQPVARTKSGIIYGETRAFRGQTLQTFLGIPFAEPPVGELRFKRPVPKKPWSAPLQAQCLPAACVQYSAGPFPWRDDLPGHSEDCLYLNVWVPPKTSMCSRKAVLFWIHGGGYFIGSNRLPMYDATALAAEGDVVVVTTNFRVGVLGFYHSNKNDAPGNAAIYDVVAALKWTHENIEFFGGDKDRITVWGTSSGGMAAGLLTISPLSRDLFRYAILESSSPANFLGDRNALNERSSQRVAAQVGCANASFTLAGNQEAVTACMRRKSALALVRAENVLSSDIPIFFPHFGDELLPEDPLQAVKNKNFKATNMLIGNVVDEGSLFLTSQNVRKFGFFGQIDAPVTKSFAKSFINASYARVHGVEDIIRYYVGSVPEDKGLELRFNAYSAYGDKIFLCPSVYFAENFAEKGNNEVYFFYFSHRPSNSVWAPWMGAAHYEHVKFTFGLPLLRSWEYTREEYLLSKRMIWMWTNFAKTGVPSSNWPRYSRQNPELVYLDIRPSSHFGKTGRGPHRENCDFLRPYLGF